MASKAGELCLTSQMERAQAKLWGLVGVSQNLPLIKELAPAMADSLQGWMGISDLYL